MSGAASGKTGRDLGAWAQWLQQRWGLVCREYTEFPSHQEQESQAAASRAYSVCGHNSCSLEGNFLFLGSWSASPPEQSISRQKWIPGGLWNVRSLCVTAGVGIGSQCHWTKENKTESCLSSEEPEHLTLWKCRVSLRKVLLTVRRCWGEVLWVLQRQDRSPPLLRPTPVQVKSWGGTSNAQILFPSALGPRAATQNGINWDYGGFGCLAATQGWMLNLCLSDLDSCLIKLVHSGHCLPRTFLSKEWLQVVLLCDRLLALLQYMALMDGCNTTFLSEIPKSTSKFNRFSPHLSGFFLWWQNVNRCDFSRIYRTDVELLLCKRKEHLFGKYSLSRDVKIQSISPPLSNSLLQIKRCPLESPGLMVPGALASLCCLC